MQQVESTGLSAGDWKSQIRNYFKNFMPAGTKVVEPERFGEFLVSMASYTGDDIQIMDSSFMEASEIGEQKLNCQFDCTEFTADPRCSFHAKPTGLSEGPIMRGATKEENAESIGRLMNMLEKVIDPDVSEGPRKGEGEI